MMGAPRIAVLCPVHRRVRVVAAQIDNYHRFHGAAAFHVLHVAQAAEPELTDLAQHLQTPAEVHLNRDGWMTSQRCVFGAVLSNALYLRRHFAGAYTHVYFHSDADLLVHGDLPATVTRHANGFQAVPIRPGWAHWRRCRVDPAFAALLARLGLEAAGLSYGRQAGAFFTAALWEEMIDLALAVFDRAHFDDPARHWPVEEVLFPTLARRLLGPGARHGRSIVRTREIDYSKGPDARGHPDNVVRPEDVRALIARADGPDDCLGLKWFSPDLDHPARRLLEETGPERTGGPQRADGATGP